MNAHILYIYIFGKRKSYSIIITRFVRIHEDLYELHSYEQNCSRISENCQGSLENHQGLLKNHWEWLVNHWESWELPRINENYLRITENCLRISKNHEHTWESQELLEDYLGINENHTKTIRSYLFNGPPPNGTHAYKIILFIILVILIDFANPYHFPTWSKPQAWIIQLCLQTAKSFFCRVAFTCKWFLICRNRQHFPRTINRCTCFLWNIYFYFIVVGDNEELGTGQWLVLSQCLKKVSTLHLKISLDCLKEEPMFKTVNFILYEDI